MSAPPLKSVDPRDLVPMDLFAADEPLAIDLVYAKGGHPENIFGIAAYHPAARLTLHKDLARIVIAAARGIRQNHGWTLVLKDGLRPIEAQKILIETDIVRANPHWLSAPRLLSSPGQGAHPRGMAIDVSALNENGAPVDMGTVFDEMTPQSARACAGLGAGILQNRAVLEKAFVRAAAALNMPLLPLPSEWWDFRIPASHSGQYAPLSDADLPGPLRMCAAPMANEEEQARMAALAKDIANSL